MRIVQLDSDDDAWAIRELATAHHEEFGSGREFDTAAVCQTVMETREQQDRTATNFWIAYNVDQRPVGYLYASCSRSACSYRLVAEQIMWFVLPEHRGSTAAIGLIKAFEGWATMLNCESVNMGVDHYGHAEMRDTMIRLMGKLGYTTRGVLATKRIG